MTLLTQTEIVQGGQSLNGWSRQGVISLCAYRFAAREILQLDAEHVADPLARGTLVHVGMAQYWEHRRRVIYGEDASRLMDPCAALTSTAHTEDQDRIDKGLEPGYRKHIDESKRAVKLYQDLRPHDETIEPHAVEWPGEIWYENGKMVPAPSDAEARRSAARERRWPDFYAMGSPWLSTFRLDLFGRMVTSNRRAVIDWKTGGQLNAKKIRGFGVSGQFVQAVLWGSENFSDFAGAYVGFIHLGNIGKGIRTIAECFPSFMAPVGVDGLKAFAWSVQFHNENLARLLEKKIDYSAWPRAFAEQGPCEDRYGPCPFMNRCMG